MLEYSTLLKQLFAINTSQKIKLGLARPQALHSILGYPGLKYRVIHVAGTNGKGSVCTKTASALQDAGYKVGLYTSPHISTFRERIRINGIMISQERVVDILKAIFSTGVDATFFEITTLMAFQYFAEEQVDFAVIETGLGGRFDATNILAPDVSVITSISLDHCEYLGYSIEDIALEKAGIIKQGTPVVIGPNVPLRLMEKIASELNAPLHAIKGGFDSYDKENSAIARKTLELIKIPALSISKGLTDKPPCRFEVHTRPHSTHQIVLDVAHNPDGFFRLFHTLEKHYPNMSVTLIAGFSKGKDIETCLDIAKNKVRHIHCLEAKNGRGLPVAELGSLMVARNIPHTLHHSAEKALEATKDAELVVVCGTFFIMAEIRAALGVCEDRDFVDMNER